MNTDKSIEIGFSPCPNDTFMFYGMINGLVDTEGLKFEPFIADVEVLNERVLEPSIAIMKGFLFLISILISTTTFSQTAKELLQQSRDCLELKDYKCSEAALLQLIKIDSKSPNLYSYYNNLGTVQRRLKKNADAMQSYNKALQLSDTSAYVYRNRASLKRVNNDLQGALEDYTRSIKLDPTVSQAYNDRGMIYKDLNDLAAAESDLKKALELNPNDYGAKSNLAVIKKRFKRFDEALNDFNELIKEHPKEAVLYNNRADTKMQMKDYDGAIIDANKAIELDPKYNIAYVTRGEILNATGKKAESCADFKHAVELGFKQEFIAHYLENCK